MGCGVDSSPRHKGTAVRKAPVRMGWIGAGLRRAPVLLRGMQSLDLVAQAGTWWDISQMAEERSLSCTESRNTGFGGMDSNKEEAVGIPAEDLGLPMPGVGHLPGMNQDAVERIGSSTEGG